MPSLQDLIKHQRSIMGEERHQYDDGVLLALDPGETTGWCIFKNAKLVNSGQLKTKTIEAAIKELSTLLKKYSPSIVVYEEYRVYGWKAQDHAWNELITSQIIGVIQTLSSIKHIPTVKQSASSAKGFATDDKLRQWSFYQRGERHARDSIRHAIYFMIFGSKKK